MIENFGTVIENIKPHLGPSQVTHPGDRPAPWWVRLTRVLFWGLYL